MQKSVITPDFEKKECVPPFRESLHQLKKQRRVSEELIMSQVTKQTLVESPVLRLCAYTDLTWSGVMNCNLVSSLSHPMKSHPFSLSITRTVKWNMCLDATSLLLIQCWWPFYKGHKIHFLKVQSYVLNVLSIFWRWDLSCPHCWMQIYSWYCTLGRTRENSRRQLVWYESPRNHKWTEKWS